MLALSLCCFQLGEMFVDGLDFGFQVLQVLFQLRDSFRARRKSACKFFGAIARTFVVFALTFAAVRLTIACVLTTFALTFAAVMLAVSVTITTASAVAMLFVTFTHFFISFETGVISRVELLHQR